MAHANVASRPYAAVEQKLAEDRCVVLDGGVATEVQRMVPAGTRPREGDLWGTWPLYRAPETVLDVHRAYVAAGCDVISTDTWSVLADTDGSGEAKSGLLHWMDIARTGIRLARTAAAEDTDRPRRSPSPSPTRRSRSAAPAPPACWRGSSRTSRPT